MTLKQTAATALEGIEVNDGPLQTGGAEVICFKLAFILFSQQTAELGADDFFPPHFIWAIVCYGIW